jgi:hypothetical protein
MMILKAFPRSTAKLMEIETSQFFKLQDNNKSGGILIENCS